MSWRVRYGQEIVAEVAYCSTGGCPWRLRTETSRELLTRAEEHVRSTGHDVVLSVDKTLMMHGEETG